MNLIVRYMKKYWHYYLIGVIVLILSVGLDLFTPIITQRIIDDVIIEGQLHIFRGLITVLIAITIGRAILGYIKELVFDFAGINLVYKLRKELFDHIQSLSIDFFETRNTGELMARIKEDAEKVWFAVSFGLMLLIELSLYFILVIIIMVNISPRLALISIIITPIIGFLARKLENNIGETYEKISEENANLNTIAQENVSGMRLVKAFAREKYEIKKFLKSNHKYYNLNMEQASIYSKFFPKMQFIAELLPITVVVFGGYIVINEQLTIGTLVAFIGYMYMLIWPMKMIGWLSNVFAEAFASGKKISAILEEKPKINNVVNPLNPTIKGVIEFKNVSLTIDKTSVLKDINFKIDKGKTIGIMGETGSGKTSIINLLLRFYDSTEGSILIDGIDAKTIELYTLRKNISIVMQDGFLFSDTIEENIEFGSKGLITKEEIIETSKKAQSFEFIDKMENKFLTVIGEKGIGLSGGQKQRISITRALAKKSPILVFDDATSSLDMETENKIQKEMDKINGITKIIIAHRIASVKNADEIIILQNGKIVERGNHRELLDRRGIYYTTYKQQYEEQEELGSEELCQ
ncbi:ATP-binding cassette subfamily B protein [Natranaerovirga pectinivora]|uniref:ATP-binding cassette subfamily B protein n=1 Tax=Natranaerovirga pectinivora TaxID=682400 RepID=A0A4R3MGI1_9FIRM|nr:ABC transporter ATP-binding protein [Natranaerovirga pectinivora]TCT13075.1 ATP-binding cassette subfamily B protein [Natranaerovirga pectinivora]